MVTQAPQSSWSVDTDESQEAPDVDASSSDAVRKKSRGDSAHGMQCSVLALNRNFQAVHVISARRAFCLLFKELAEVIHVENGHYQTYDFESWREQSELKAEFGDWNEQDDWIKAVNFEIQVPRVIRLISYDRLPLNAVKFNRRNIFLRDEHRCQYCGKRYASPRLSLDHVMPKSRGGPDTWENIVCACLSCNVGKGGRTPHEAGMKLLQQPVKPKRSPLLSRQLRDRRYEMWQHFLPKIS